jgi:hypothetical protein
MRYLISIYLLFVGLAIVLRILKDARSGKVELFSIRNMFLAGFLVFQVTSAILGLGFHIFGDIRPENFRSTPVIYAIMVTAFMFFFFWGYGKEWGVLRRIRISGSGWDGPAGGWILVSLIMLVFGAMLKIGLVSVPFVNIVASQMGHGVLAAAAGCAAWGWAKDFKNPGIATMAMAVLVAASMLMLYRAFGRRPVLGVALAFGWAMYWGLWRAMPIGMLLRRMTIWGSVALFMLLAYSASRSSAAQFEKRGIAEVMRAIVKVRPSDIGQSIAAIFTGQNAGPLSMWCIETYPAVYPVDPLHQVKYLVSMPIPRQYFPGKPDALGKIIVEHGYIRFKGAGNQYSVGSGIIGHAAHDFPWIALPLYAVGLGWMIRLVDEKVRYSLHLPATLIALGTTLGQVLAIPRGESALFVFECILGIFGAWLFIRFSGRIVAMLGGMVQTQPEAPWDPLLPSVESDSPPT